MAKSTRGIRAGRAFVELFADDSRLVRGLKRAQARIAAFGAGVRNVGLKMAGVGAAIVAPLLGASKVFANVGDQMQKMSIRTGISVEALSELGFAAEQSGSDMETLGNAVLRMNRRIGRIRAGEASSTEVSALKKLGLDAEELEKMNPEQTLNAIADAMAAMQDKTQAAGLAQRAFGTQVDKILPLLLEGSKGIERLRQRARELGLTIDKDAADRAAKFTDQMNELFRVIKRGVFAIGNALAPMLIDMGKTITGVAVAVGKWIKENRQLIATIFKVGAAILGAGVAIVIAGTAIQLFAFSIGGLLSVFALLNAAIGAAVTAIGLLLSPIGAVIAIGAGLVVMFADWRNAMRQAGDFLMDKFAEIGRIFSDTLGGIRDALAAGDLGAAARIAWLGIKLAWLEGTKEIRDLWARTKTAVMQSVADLGFGMALTLTDAFALIQTGWAETVSAMKKLWANFAAGAASLWDSTTKRISDKILEIQGAIDPEFDVEKAKQLNAQKSRVNQENIERERTAAVDQAESQRRAARAEVDKQQRAMTEAIQRAANEGAAERKKANDQAVRKTREALDAAKKELAAAVAKAGGAVAGRDGSGTSGDTPIGELGGGAGLDAGSMSRGLFNVAAILSLAQGRPGRDPQDQVANEQKRTREELADLLRKLIAVNEKNPRFS